MPVADKLPYSVVDNKLTIESIHTNAIEGDITLKGGVEIKKNIVVGDDSVFEKSVSIGVDLSVGRELRVPILRADTLITSTHIEHKEPVVFSMETGGIEGKGFVWKTDKRNVDFFIYKSDPKRVYTNLSIELLKGANLLIEGTPVITLDALGPSVLSSNLRKVGRLKELTVDGDVTLGEHIFFDATSTRIGIGTDHANAAFSLVDNGVEVVLGSVDDSTGMVGTFTSHDLGLVTDNTTRMKITRGGKVIFGEAKAANADVTINGKLYVKELVVDNHEERQSPLEFKAVGSSNYGKGMLFTGDGLPKQFVFAASPDQFYSSEHLNLAEGKEYFIDRDSVLSAKKLGSSVTKSSLKELGTLSYLNVEGDVNFSDSFKVIDKKVWIGDAEISVNNGVTFNGSKITLQSGEQTVTVTSSYVALGNKDLPMTHVIVNGKMSVGMQTVGNDAQFEVSGNIRFADKLFKVGSTAPTQGMYRKGDIVWNDNPKETGYVGWVCIRDGNPGIWRGFGQIGVE